MEKRNNFKIVVASVSLTTLAASLISCTGGSGDVEVSNGGSTGVAGVTLYSATVPTGKNIVSTGGTSYSVNSSSMTIQGSCQRGVAAVKVTVNSVSTGNVECNESAMFESSVSLNTSATNALLFEPVSSVGAVIAGGATITLSVYSDSTAPTGTNVVLTNASSGTATAGSTTIVTTQQETIGFSITAVGADTVTVRVVGDGTTTDTSVTPSGSWSATTAMLPPEVQQTYEIYELDAAGNISPATTVRVTSSPTILFYAYEFSYGSSDSTAVSDSMILEGASIVNSAVSTGLQTIATGTPNLNGYTGNISIVTGMRNLR
ncbi:MAG: hypothetical protein LW875_05680 [Proteobacteria bacterium]|jgi:hypothetical protein|nr:hypothetical protein [Pseudomonadota bacterium]